MMKDICMSIVQLHEAPIILKIDLKNENNSELFFDGTELAKEYPGNFDGLKVHSSGNIFTTGPNGILVLSHRWYTVG